MSGHYKVDSVPSTSDEKEPHNITSPAEDEESSLAEKLLTRPKKLLKYCEQIANFEEMPNNTSEKEEDQSQKQIGCRSLIAFWILGLCNNYGYVIMLTAAHDILSSDGEDENPKNVRHCNTLSTGAVLLADIIPALVIKLIAPFFPLVIHFRMILVLLLAATGFILVAEEINEWVAILGVVFTALSSGLGEVTLLSYIAFYKNKNVISTWSSGTGGAGFFGSLTYAGLTYLGMSNRATLYSLLIVPAIMGISFWLILEKPDIKFQSNVIEETNSRPNLSQVDDINNDSDGVPLTANTETLFLKLKASQSLLKYMIPLCLVYFFEYLINQGLTELVQFDIDWLNYKQQYKWYQVDYQIGVFMSRSSINFIKINKTWILALFQGINLIIFATEAVYSYVPNIYITLFLILWEGLLGGAAYVNTYYRISNEVSIDKQEFSMAFTSLSDAIGISLSGFIAIPIHNFICRLPKY